MKLINMQKAKVKKATTIGVLLAVTLSLSGCGSDSSNNASNTTVPPSNSNGDSNGDSNGTGDSNLVLPPTSVNQNFIGFESAPVRPIAQTTDGTRLLVSNTSNNSLEIFTIGDDGQLSWQQSVPVGLEPVSVAVNGNHAWVVNHLSDSVSIIDLAIQPARVVRTLLVGDEPRDIVFAKHKAFISTAHRGQQRLNPTLAGVEGAGNPELHTPGIGRADIWIFDTLNLDGDLEDSLGGKPLEIATMFGDTLRGLAVSNDQNTVYAGVLNSGNQTTAVHEAVLCYGYEDDEYGAYPCQVLDGISSPNGLADGYLPGGRTAPGVNADGEYQPWTSMIVKYNRQTGQWQDSKGRNFSNGVRFNLPDNDVFALDVNSHQVVN